VTTELARPRLAERDNSPKRAYPLAAERMAHGRSFGVHRDTHRCSFSPLAVPGNGTVGDSLKVPADHRDPDPDRVAVHGAVFYPRGWRLIGKKPPAIGEQRNRRYMPAENGDPPVNAWGFTWRLTSVCWQFANLRPWATLIHGVNLSASEFRCYGPFWQRQSSFFSVVERNFAPSTSRVPADNFRIFEKKVRAGASTVEELCYDLE